jgi:hypothetical protein
MSGRMGAARVGMRLGPRSDNPPDSRVLSQVGYVPFATLIGRVEKIIISIDYDSGGIRFERTDPPRRAAI